MIIENIIDSSKYSQITTKTYETKPIEFKNGNI